MTAAADTGALALTAAGLAVLVVGAVLTRRWRPALAATLDLWTAAGLLRLAADTDPRRLAAAAGVIAVRQLVGLGLRPSACAADRQRTVTRRRGAHPRPH